MYPGSKAIMDSSFCSSSKSVLKLSFLQRQKMNVMVARDAFERSLDQRYKGSVYFWCCHCRNLESFSYSPSSAHPMILGNPRSHGHSKLINIMRWWWFVPANWDLVLSRGSVSPSQVWECGKRIVKIKIRGSVPIKGGEINIMTPPLSNTA